jgi:hypothetical protein
MEVLKMVQDKVMILLLVEEEEVLELLELMGYLIKEEEMEVMVYHTQFQDFLLTTQVVVEEVLLKLEVDLEALGVVLMEGH